MASKTRSTNKEEQFNIDSRDGRDDAYRWLETHPPTEIRQLYQCRNYSISHLWKRVQRFDPSLASKFKARGQRYANMFVDTVRAHWEPVNQAWTHHLYRQGVVDGTRWSETATENQIKRLRDACLPDSQSEFSHGIRGYDGGAVTPGHELVILLLGDDYPVEKLPGETQSRHAIECEEFRSFWEPFFRDSLDELLSLLHSHPEKQLHTLQEPDYVCGFIDGAIGLGNHLMASLSRFRPLTPLSPWVNYPRVIEEVVA